MKKQAGLKMWKMCNLFRSLTIVLVFMKRQVWLLLFFFFVFFFLGGGVAVEKKTVTGGLRLGRSEMLRSFIHYLRAQ